MHLRETAEDVDEAISATEELLKSLRLLVIEVWSYIASLKPKDTHLWTIKQKKPGGHWTQFYAGRLRDDIQPLALLYTIFDRKVLFSFRIPTNGTPFTYLVQNLGFLFH